VAVLSALLETWTRSGQGAMSDLGTEDLELLRLIAAGLESTEIAERLHVSERTAKQRVGVLLRRIGVSNRLQAAALAGRCGLLAPPEP